MRRFRLFFAAAVLTATAFQVLASFAQSQPPAPYTVFTREGRRSLVVRVLSGQEMVSLDDLTKLFDLSVREDTLAGGIAVSTKTQTIALTPGQALASVSGRVVSLPSPPVREGRTWYVPIDFIPRALGPATGIRIQLRRPSRTILVGDVRVPRIGARFEPQGQTLRTIVDVSPATPHAIAQEGNRLVIRFEADALDATFPPSPQPDLVQGIRQVDTGVAVAIDLGPRFASFRAADSPGDAGAGRITVDVVPSTTEAPPAPAAPAAPVGPPPVFDVAPPGSLRAIVIDPGHGGDEHGARGAQGTLEKDITLGIARRLKSAIEARLGTRVVLTREGDQTVGLDERAALANNNKADLFISLHANASVRPSVAGAEVFSLSLADYGDRAQQIAQGERETLPVFNGGSRDIEVILWEMAQARHIEQSSTLARIVEASLRERIPMSPRALQQAPFRVLVGANMPAVLIEVGFMTNPDQEKQLASEAFQSSVVQAVVEAIVRFRDARNQRPAPAAPTGRGERD